MDDGFAGKPRLASEDVERVFRQLQMIFGKDFSARWNGFYLDEVKANWAERLAWCSPQEIDWALQHLPERAPNVVQFAALCQQAPAPVEQSAADDFTECRQLTPEELAHVQEVIARAKAAALAKRVPLADGTLVSPHVAASARRADGSPWPARRPDGSPWTFDIEGIASRMARGAELRGDWLRMFAARMERGDARIGVYQREQVKRAMRDGTIEPFAVDVPQALPAPPAPTPAPAPSRQPTVQVLDALDAPQEASWIDQWAAEALPV